MNSVPCFVGLDYHQDSVQVCVLDREGRQLLNRSCPNDWKTIADAVQRVGQVQRAALEACSGSANLGEELVQKAGWSVDLAHPGYVERMKRSPDKTDFSDGRMLADLTRVGYLPVVWLAPAAVRDLRQLVNYRQGLVDQRRTTKLRIRSVLREHRAKCDCARPWTGVWLAWIKESAQLSEQARWIITEHLDELEHLDEKIAAAEKRLRKVTADDTLIARLRQEPGVGEVTAWVLRAFVGRFDRFNTGKQLSRFCGLSPCNASTGQKQADAGLIRATNKLLRTTLIQAAHRLIRTEPRWFRFSARLRGRGKPACVAVAAVANRWVRGLLHRMKTAQPVEAGGAGTSTKTGGRTSSRRSSDEVVLEGQDGVTVTQR
jgi:transposase